MPTIDAAAKAYEADIAEQFAVGLRRRRRALGITASELSRRTQDLGYAITRSAIAKMENNARGGKVDIVEWLVLSAALDIPPVLLLFPTFPAGGAMRVLPNVSAEGREVASWIFGLAHLPTISGPEQTSVDVPPPNDGMKLVAAVQAVIDGLQKWGTAQVELEDAKRRSDAVGAEFARQAVQLTRQRLSVASAQANEAELALWDGLRPFGREQDEGDE